MSLSNNDRVLWFAAALLSYACSPGIHFPQPKDQTLDSAPSSAPTAISVSPIPTAETTVCPPVGTLKAKEYSQRSDEDIRLRLASTDLRELTVLFKDNYGVRSIFPNDKVEMTAGRFVAAKCGEQLVNAAIASAFANLRLIEVRSTFRAEQVAETSLNEKESGQEFRTGFDIPNDASWIQFKLAPDSSESEVINAIRKLEVSGLVHLVEVDAAPTK